MNKGIIILIAVIAILVVGAAFLMNPSKQESIICSIFFDILNVCNDVQFLNKPVDKR